MELVTGHGASEHITAAQVSRLIQGVTVMDDTTVYRLNVGNNCAIGVNGLTVGISTGEMVLHGYHTTFEDAETLTLDPTLDAAKSRIDKLCLIISEDLTTGIQSAYIQVVQGTEATTPTAPATPSTPTSPTELYMGVGVIATVTVSDTVIASYVDNTDLYAGSFVTLNELETNMSNIAPIEKTSTASKAYAIGDNLIYNGILYKVDAAIAQGATLVPSGNISLSPDVEAQIASLKSCLNNQLCQTGLMPSTLNETKKMTTTFKPKKFIMFMFNGSAGTQSIFKYDANIDNTLIRFITSTGNIDFRTIGTSNCIVKSVDNDGITLIPYAQALLNNPFLVFYF